MSLNDIRHSLWKNGFIIITLFTAMPLSSETKVEVTKFQIMTDKIPQTTAVISWHRILIYYYQN